MKFNATPLLSDEEDGFLPQITPTETQMGELREYRQIVRDTIRVTFSVLNNAFEKDKAGKWQLSGRAIHLPFVDQLRKLKPEQKSALAGLTPKFMSQGSFVYKTLNLPCHNPPQQIDLDDGIYLPLEIFRESPIVSKDLFFSIVDRALNNLAENMGWTFEEKNTCARLIVSDLIHIDVPLYAIPLERHVAMESMKANRADSAWFTDSRSLLAKDDVYLAVRNRESWVNSDPATISEWFKDQIRFHGEVLRNVCRHLKAWRDYKFSSGGGPSSIALMACAAQTFSEIAEERGKKFTSAQESEALMLCAERLEKQFTKGVPNPADDTKPQLYPSSEMSEEQISKDKEFALELATDLSFSLKEAENKQQSVDGIRRALGLRVPNRQDLIDVATAAGILSKPAKTNPAPVVPNGDAG